MLHTWIKRGSNQKIVLLLVAVNVNILLSGFGPPYPKDILLDPQDASTFRGQILSPVEQVDMVPRPNRNVDLVWRYHKRIVSMPDETIQIPQNNSGPFGKILTIMPGQTEKSYRFHPSPDHKWLFVEQGVFRRLSICYLYHWERGDRAIPIRIDGMRLDDAVLSEYAKAKGVDSKLLGGGARTCRFKKWDTAKHRVLIEMEASSYWYSASQEKVKSAYGKFVASYDTDSNRISIVSTGK